MRSSGVGARLVWLTGLVLVCVSILEGGARLAGYKSWPENSRLLGFQEGLHQVDPELGWRKQTGVFQFERFERELTVTHWTENRRASATRPTPQSRRVLFLGGSFVYGLGLSDSETLPWKMQSAFPEIEWLNLATSGYGTLQSLLTLEEYLEKHATPPTLVIYGYNWFHAERNVAADSWQYAMAISSPETRLPFPFVWLDDHGNLVRGVHTYPDWPLKRTSAAVALMERVWNKLQVRGRADQGQQATRQLILEMDALARSAGSSLLVMIMGRCEDRAFFRQQGIDFVDCMPSTYTPELSLPDSHPSGLRNDLYADCLGSYLRQSRLFPEP
jgi:hypothetical protein